MGHDIGLTVAYGLCQDLELAVQTLTDCSARSVPGATTSTPRRSLNRPGALTKHSRLEACPLLNGGEPLRGELQQTRLNPLVHGSFWKFSRGIRLTR